MQKQKKSNKRSSRSKYNLYVLLSIIFLFLLTTGLQYYLTWQGIEKELQARARIEMNVNNERNKQLKNEVELAVNSSAIAYEQQLDHPEQMSEMLVMLVRNNPHVSRSCVAFIPNYVKPDLRLYAPSAQRKNGEITRRLLSVDYTQTEWFGKVTSSGLTCWSEPYTDNNEDYLVKTTYAVPLKNSNGVVVAVLACDVPMTELSQVGTDIQRSISSRTKLIMAIQVLVLVLIGLVLWRATSSIRRIEKVEREKSRITDELNMARGIQAKIVPVELPQTDKLETSASLISAHDVSGDFYDVLLQGDRLFFCIGDVASHGIGASLAMLVTRSVYRTVVRHEVSPAQIMTEMNGALGELNENQMFASLFVGMLDLKTRAFHYCNAGHRPPFLITPTTGVETIEADPNVPVGISEWEFTEQSCQLEKGTTIFLSTEGLIEVTNGHGDPLGIKKLILHLKNGAEAGETTQQLVQRIEGVVHRHVMDAVINDDITMLAIRLK